MTNTPRRVPPTLPPDVEVLWHDTVPGLPLPADDPTGQRTTRPHTSATEDPMTEPTPQPHDWTMANGAHPTGGTVFKCRHCGDIRFTEDAAGVPQLPPRGVCPAPLPIRDDAAVDAMRDAKAQTPPPARVPDQPTPPQHPDDDDGRVRPQDEQADETDEEFAARFPPNGVVRMENRRIRISTVGGRTRVWQGGRRLHGVTGLRVEWPPPGDDRALPQAHVTFAVTDVDVDVESVNVATRQGVRSSGTSLSLADLLGNAKQTAMFEDALRHSEDTPNIDRLLGVSIRSEGGTMTVSKPGPWQSPPQRQQGDDLGPDC